MNIPDFFPVGSLVIDIHYPEFPYEVRAVDIRVTEKGATVLYCLLEARCDKDTPYEFCRTLYSGDIAPYVKFKVGDQVVHHRGGDVGVVTQIPSGFAPSRLYTVRHAASRCAYYYEGELRGVASTSPHDCQD